MPSTKKKMSLTPQELLNVFTTALEGGIGYWSTASKYHWCTPGKEGEAYTDDVTGFYAIIQDVEDNDKEYRIDAAVIKRGMRRLLEGTCTFGGKAWPESRSLWGRVMAEDYDSNDADNVVQAGLFGDIIYG